MRSTLPLLLLALFSIPFIYSRSFIFLDDYGEIQRGLVYYFFGATSIFLYGIFVFQIICHIKDCAGIRRLELQFLALTTGGAALVIAMLNILGNLFSFRALNNAGIIIMLFASTVTAWALLFHRVFNAREVLLQLSQRGTFILVTCGGTYILWSLIHSHIAEPFGMLVSLVVCGSAAVWLDKSSRGWFESGNRRKLDSMRKAAIQISNTEVRFESLISSFEILLQTECEARSCALLFDDGEVYSGSGMILRKDSAGFSALIDIEWTTPESLLRRKTTVALADLQDFVERQELGLLITTPRGSPNPSVIVALGRRCDESPFTYPEVERLQALVALLDNLIARSRRVAHTALQARIEYLAVASRGLAHDLKNLITPVSSYLVHTEGIFSQESSAGEVYAAAQKATQVMSDYVRENLFFSEKLTPRLERFDFHALLEQVRDVTLPPAEARNVAVTISESSRSDFVADRVLIQRMLVNLVANAIDASLPGGSVCLSAKDTRPGWIRLDVADQGSGITPENLNRIFDPYFTTKEFGDELRGFGLGLTIAQRIVLLHNGKISVLSRPGQGTTFTVEIPNAQDESQPSAVRVADTEVPPLPTAAHVLS
jgi:signal transduction histidine kinase